MLFSGKISHSVLVYFEHQGLDFSELLASEEWSMGSLRNPSQWIQAPVLESFFESLIRLFPEIQKVGFQKAGHEGSKLHSWGVLDSVLRMMSEPQEVFSNPEALVSYFVSPKPPVDNIVRTSSSLTFDWPLPSGQYPLVEEYLKAAFESLPTYSGNTMAICEWTGIRLRLDWKNSEKPAFVDENRQISPELIQSLIVDLQNTQNQRESLQVQLADMELKIQAYEDRWLDEKPDRHLRPTTFELVDLDLKEPVGVKVVPDLSQLSSLAEDFANDDENEIGSTAWKKKQVNQHCSTLSQNLARMHDYMVRAQQLNTILLSELKNSTAAKEAMRRVDWSFVKDQYPLTVSDSMEIVRKIKKNNT